MVPSFVAKSRTSLCYLSHGLLSTLTSLNESNVISFVVNLWDADLPPALIQEILVAFILGCIGHFLWFSWPSILSGTLQQNGTDVDNSWSWEPHIQSFWSLDVLIILVVWWGWSIQLAMLLVLIHWCSFGDGCSHAVLPVDNNVSTTILPVLGHWELDLM